MAGCADPAVRDAVVRQDLGNVLHPIVQHKVLETKQMVVTGGDGSTIGDGTYDLGAAPVGDQAVVSAALQQAQAELAHVTRMTTLGELTAWIAHEVKQPLTAIVLNGAACL